MARQYGPTSVSICHAQIGSSSLLTDQRPKTPIGPPVRPPGLPAIVMTRSIPRRAASWIAPFTAACASARNALSGCSGLPAALTALNRMPASSRSRRSSSRAAGSRSNAARSRWVRAPQVPTLISTSVMSCAAAHASASRRGMCLSPSVKSPIRTNRLLLFRTSLRRCAADWLQGETHRAARPGRPVLLRRWPALGRRS